MLHVVLKSSRGAQELCEVISDSLPHTQPTRDEIIVLNIYDFQRAITLNVLKPELMFFCSALCLTVFYISLQFYENV